MLRRLIEEDLEAFRESDEKKCLVIRGARQVGKTFSVERFGEDKSNFESYISVNFLKEPRMKEIFSGNLDVDTLLLNFSLYMPDAVFIPGHTLLLLDEIQECPEAVTSLKFWAEDGRFKVIATGSMLGIDYKRPSSYPVGFVKYIDMKPLNFHEFLWGAGVPESTVEALRGFFLERRRVPDAIHSQMMKYLQMYMVIGGMPEVAARFFDRGSIREADELQRSILQDYRYDIAHYASPDIKIKAEKCFFSIPDQLSKPNHKFQYSVVEKGGSRRKYGSSLDWIVNADLVFLCRNVNKIGFPLRSFAEDNNFRMYAGDIGLLTGMYDYSLKAALLNESQNSDIYIGQAKGGLYEALVADLLEKNGHSELYFYSNESKKMEIEFLVPSAEGVIPIEVKAKNNRSRSLDRLLREEHVRLGYKLVSGNTGVSGKKVTLPLYMAMFL